MCYINFYQNIVIKSILCFISFIPKDIQIPVIPLNKEYVDVIWLSCKVATGGSVLEAVKSTTFYTNLRTASHKYICVAKWISRNYSVRVLLVVLWIIKVCATPIQDSQMAIQRLVEFSLVYYMSK